MARPIVSTLRAVGEWALHVQLFIAGCAVMLCLAAEKLFLGAVPPLGSPLHGLLAAGTLLAYNVHAVANVQWETVGGLQPRRRPVHVGVAVASAVIVALLLPRVTPKIWIGLGALGIVTAAYSTPLLPFRYKQRLKDFGILKLVVLVGTWVMSTTWLPALKWNIPLQAYWPELIIRAALLLALCIAFDVRDMAADKAAGIYTLPVRIGARAAYGVGFTVLVASIIFSIGTPTVPRATMVAACIAGGYACTAVQWSRRRPSAAAYILLVDGALMVYATAVLLF